MFHLQSKEIIKNNNLRDQNQKAPIYLQVDVSTRCFGQEALTTWTSGRSSHKKIQVITSCHSFPQHSWTASPRPGSLWSANRFTSLEHSTSCWFVLSLHSWSRYLSYLLAGGKEEMAAGEERGSFGPRSKSDTWESAQQLSREWWRKTLGESDSRRDSAFKSSFVSLSFFLGFAKRTHSKKEWRIKKKYFSPDISADLI